jgi:hypothetical protein
MVLQRPRLEGHFLISKNCGLNETDAQYLGTRQHEKAVENALYCIGNSCAPAEWLGRKPDDLTSPMLETGLNGGVCSLLEGERSHGKSRIHNHIRRPC